MHNMATTTNYGWDTPDDTDLVKDGALAMRDLGEDIDSTLYTALGGAYPGLRFIKKQTIGTGVTSVSVTNVFSSTYDNYRILIQADSSSGSSGGYFALNGVTTAYYVNAQYMGLGSSTITGTNTANVSQWNIFYFNANGTPMAAQIDLFNPFRTIRKTGFFSSQTGNGSANGNFLNNTTLQPTGFTVGKDNSETLSGGTIYVYGYGAS